MRVIDGEGAIEDLDGIMIAFQCDQGICFLDERREEKGVDPEGAIVTEDLVIVPLEPPKCVPLVYPG